jgi:hypothetical protein
MNQSKTDLGIVHESQLLRFGITHRRDRMDIARPWTRFPKGRDGLMSRKGFFDWEGRSPKELFREREPQTDRVEARYARHRDRGGAVIIQEFFGAS